MDNPMISNDLQQRVGAFLKQSHGLYIDGRWMPAQSGETFTTENPATGETIARISAGAEADIDLAVSAARKAFERGPWSSMPPAARARMIEKLADAIEAHAEDFALIESIDNGMPFMSARMFNVGGAVGALRYNAGWATRLGGETSSPSIPGEWHAYTLREPLGVAGLIVAWNMPLAMAVSKLAAALAAGCTVVLKPAELTSLSMVRVLQLIDALGFPPGVVNLVTGTGAAGAALAAHPGVDKISFTGSTAVGKSIVTAATGNLKRVTLELGGKSPGFIFGDALLGPAIEASARSIFSNAGQTCVAGSRLFVHTSVFDQVVEGIAERARQFKVGAGTTPGTEIGPLISRRQRERVTGYIDSGREEGAEVIVGGAALDGDGYFIQPTVLTRTVPAMRVMREEIFGPVLCVVPFGDENDLDSLADQGNDTPYGLSASIWTRDISVAHRLARRLKAGTVRINTAVGMDSSMPFGGYKQSGWGRENGRSGVEAYTEIKSVFVGL
ncbi:MAG: aldehyde dehydrogenase family protein [Rhodanobacter sp.]